jgi:hypothetical protein
MAAPNNTFKFKRNFDIGTLDAESDIFLIKAFVYKEEYELLKDINSHRCIILGRTGSGKSALIKYLESDVMDMNVSRIQPQSISLRHLSNSTIIQYFNALAIKLDLFYKLLWKHLFIVEILKHFINESNERKDNFLEWLKSKLPDKKKKRALNYLDKWEDLFWETTELQVRELEASLEKRFAASMELKIPLSEFISGSAKSHSEVRSIEKVKIDVINKAKKVVNESQVEEIQELFNVLRDDILPKINKPFYLVIDDLDEEWVSNSIVYDLIRSLLDTIREFRQLPNIKIIVALRSNIHEIIFSENTSRGVQREKFEHLYLNLNWTNEELATLVNRRLSVLMKASYTNNVPEIQDILPLANKRKESGFHYMLERSFMRPRDIIDFFNKCIGKAEGRTKFTREIIYDAEYEYSNSRLHAIHDEWLENYGKIDCLFNLLLDIGHRFVYDEIKTTARTHFIDIMVKNEHLKLNDYLKSRFEIFGNEFDTDKILPDVLIVLFNVGILGIKSRPDSKITYSFTSSQSFGIEDMKSGVTYFVHPMFNRALRIHDINDKWISAETDK